MSKWNKLPAVLLACALLFTATVFSVFAEPSPLPPSVSARSAVLIEAESGNVVYSKNAHEILPMASTTKIMTALVALELAPPDTVITVDPAAVGVEGSSVYLTEGEQLTLEQLLYALMLESANDAATAIAIGLSGSVEHFADAMNRKASELGLLTTHFSNPHGLDDEGHFTSALELARITREALKNELLRTIVSTRKTTIPHAGIDTNRLLVNHNKMLRIYDGCIGVKTGFTKKSGRCLVSAAERDGVVLIAVTLDAPDDWRDHAAMLDYGFTQYESVILCEAESVRVTLPLTGGTQESILLCNKTALHATLPVTHGEITYTVEVPHFAYAPVRGGDSVGRIVFQCDTDGDGTAEIIGACELVACETAPKKERKKSFWQWLKSLLGLD